MSTEFTVFNRKAIKNGAPDFPNIKNDDFVDAVKEGIRLAKLEIESIKNNPATPDFENTIFAMEVAGQELSDSMSVFSDLKGAHGTDDLHEMAPEISSMLAQYSNDIALDEDLFKRIDAVWQKKDSLGLDDAQMMVLENSWIGFVRGGAKLNKADKNSLRKIDAEMATLTPAFNKNALDSTNAYEFVIDDETMLDGVPAPIKAGMREEAKKRGHKGDKWSMTLTGPNYISVLYHAKSRELREKMWRGWSNRAFGDNFDNQQVVKDIVRLRYERAQLLGYDTHADYVLERRMAKDKKTVLDFIDRIVNVTKPIAEKELQELRDLAAKDGIKDMMPWDTSYYAEQLKKAKYDFDPEDFRPYLQQHNVMEGLFLHAEKLFGLEFKETQDYPSYHEDVTTYEVFDKDSGAFYGVLRVDLFPRKEKRQGAWMSPGRSRGLNRDGEIDCPLISIVCNFTKPVEGQPALLSLDDVETLFHEFGHALHGLMTKVDYSSISGTSVKWDFVELPSQLQENWLGHKETWDLFAVHHETGDKIPEELLNKMIASQNFMAASQMLRQMSLATLDMAWHTNTNPAAITDVEKFEKDAVEDITLLKHKEKSCTSTSFGHIFAGGYSAGYYSYMWAEGLDADAFEPFIEKGLYNKAQGTLLRDTIYAKGGAVEPMELYKEYRGRAPDPDALLRKRGILPPKP